MSDVSQGPGWWQASNGRWYPPKEADRAPAPGWWLASDGKWYPPKESDDPPHPGWWLASDGKWYPPKEPDPESRVAAPTPLEVRVRNEAAEVAAGTSGADPDDDDAEEGIGPARVARVARTTRPAASTPRPLPERPARSADHAKAKAKPKATTGRGPGEQIRQRNEASRQDAVALAPARFLAAARAVQLLEVEIKATAAAPPAPPEPPPPAPEAAAEPVTPPGTGSPVLALDLDRVTTADDAGADEIGEGAVTDPTAASAHDGSDDAVDHLIEDLRPLIEVRSSPLGADIDHLGDRLVVYADRVELHDRLDNARQVIAAAEITDVTVLRRFTGAMITIESSAGADIVLKGAKPELADTAAALIDNRTRQGQPRRPRPTASTPLRPLSAAASAHAANRLAILNRDQLNEADLLRKLADLHRAGVLSDSEFQDKIALVGRLVSGETILVR